MFHSRSLSKEILVSLEDVTCPVEPRAQESNRQNEPTLMGDGWHQSVFAKTDTRRQAELVWLIAESISAELIVIGSRSYTLDRRHSMDLPLGKMFLFSTRGDGVPTWTLVGGLNHQYVRI